jgi:hypothetical protein
VIFSSLLCRIPLLPSVRLPSGDNADIGPPLGKGHMIYSLSQRAQQMKALLPVVRPSILGHHPALICKAGDHIDEIKPVFFEVPRAFVFIPLKSHVL